VGDEVAPEPAVVEQRVALRRRAVGGDAQTLLLEVDEEAQDLPFVALHALCVALVCLELLVARPALALAQLPGGLRLRLLRILLVAAEDAQRAAVGRQLFD